MIIQNIPPKKIEVNKISPYAYSLFTIARIEWSKQNIKKKAISANNISMLMHLH